MKKIVLTLVLCFVGFFALSGGVAPKVEAAAEWYDVPGVVGGQIEFDKSTGTITNSGVNSYLGGNYITVADIPSHIEGVKVEKIGDDAFAYARKLTKVIIPEGVTSIGRNAFEHNLKLTDITIPETVTAIDSYAFRDCSSLVSIKIPKNVTRLGNSAFYNCSSLERVELPEGLKIISSGAFSICSSLQEITIPSEIDYIGGIAFYGCDSLTEVDIPHYENTDYGDDIFDHCDNLKVINIVGSGSENSSDFSSYSFGECLNLQEINVSPENLTYASIDGVFFEAEDKGKTELTMLIYPAGRAGEYTMPEETWRVYHSAFAGCDKLTKLNLSRQLAIDTVIKTSLRDCINLTEINAHPESTRYSSVAGSLYRNEFVNVNGDVIEKELFIVPTGKQGVYVVPDDVDVIGRGAFSGCTKITSVVIPDNFHTIGEGAFSGCTNLESISLPSSIKTIESNTFKECVNLKSITIPDGVELIDRYAFINCDNLAEITLPKTLYEIDDRVFRDSNNIERIFYAGTSSDWEKIRIGSSNDSFEAAQVIYNSLGGIDLGNGKSSIELEIGETIDFLTLQLPETIQGKEFILESSNPLVASVSGNIITAENAGNIVGSLKIKNSGKSYTFFVKVTPPDLGLDENSLNFGTVDEATTIEGPTIGLLGYSFNLFQYELEMKSNLISSHFEFNATFDEEDMKTRVIIQSNSGKLEINSRGEFTKFEEVKELVNAVHKLSNKKFHEKYSSVVESSNKNKLDIGFSFETTGIGYLEFDHQTGPPVFQEGGLILKLDTSFSMNYKFPPAPVVYVEIGFEVDGKGGLKFVVEDMYTEDSSIDVTGFIELGFIPYLEVGIDALIGKVAFGLNGEINFKVVFPEKSLKDAITANLSSDAYFEWSAFLFWSKRYPYTWADYQLYPKDEQTSEIQSNIPMAMSASMSDDTFVIDEIEMKPMPRTSEFVNMSQMQRMSPMSLSATNNQTTINSNIFQNAEPSLITAGGVTIAVFEMDEASRASGDRTMLYYSVKTESGWSAISPVEDDGTADFAPQLFAINDEIYVLWNNGVTTLGEISTVEETVANLTLRVAKYDGTGFVGATNVSTPNGKFAVAVDVATNGTTANISWVENSLNSVFDFEGSYTIKSTTYDGTSFGAVQEIYNSAYPITNIVGGYNAGSYVLSFIESIYNGNQLQTSSVNLFKNGTVTPLSVTTDRKSNLDILNETVFWIENGNATIVDLSGVEPLKTILLEDAALIQRANLIENNAGEHALIYSAGENYHSEIYVRYQQGEEFTQPIQLTKDGKAASVSGVDFNDEDELNILFTSTAINDNPPSGSSAFGQTELRFLTSTNEIDLQIVGEPYFDPAQVVPGQVMPININVKNNSSVAISSMRVFQSNGSLKNISILLQPGETGTISLNYTVPSNIVQSTINIEIKPETGDDANDLDNSTTTELFYRDIAVVGYEIEDDQATITVKNNSRQSVGNVTVELLDKNLDGNVLQSQTIASMNAGEIKTVVFTLTNAVEIVDVYDVSYYYVNAFISEPENIYANNFMATPKVPKRVESITLINDEITIAKGESAKLQATVLPADALNTDVFWVSSDESVATIDENGNVQGLKRGEITVTAVTKDNALMTTAFVNVTSTGSFISGEISSYDPKKEVSINLFDKDDDERTNPLYTSIIPAEISGSGLKVQPFDVQDVLPGTYDMVISKQGHASVTVTDIVVADTDIVLTESLSVALKSIWLPAGDINGDGWVNFEDILIAIYVTNYGQQIGASGANPSADVTGDEWINFEDLLVLIYVLNYGKGDITIPFS